MLSRGWDNPVTSHMDTYDIYKGIWYVSQYIWRENRKHNVSFYEFQTAQYCSI